MKSSLLQPQHVDNVPSSLKKRKEIQAKYYNRGSRTLTELHSGKLIRVKTIPIVDGERQKWKRKLVFDLI